MRLKKITLENIRSYKNQEVEFPEGSILLSGDIGSGKTSILLGIEFALFGLQPGQKGSSLLRNGEQFGKVIMNFEVDGKSITVERILKRGKSISQEECFLSVDGERKETSVMELKSFILDLLSYPAEFSKKQNLLYKFTVYTPQEEMKQIILQDPETRINTLRHIFGIDKYKKILENTSILTAKIREEKRLKEALTINSEQDKANLISKEDEMETKRRNISSMEREMFVKTEERKKIQEEKDAIQEKISEKSVFLQEIEKSRIIISAKKDSMSNNSRNISQINMQLLEFQDLKFDESEILRLEEELKMKKRGKVDLSDSLIKISSEINSLNSKNMENGDVKSRIASVDICPTCLQEVNVLYKNNIMGKLNTSIFENLKKMESLNFEKSSLQIKMSEMETEINWAEKKIQDHRIMRIKINDLNEKRAKISELENNSLKLEKEISEILFKISLLENSIVELRKFDAIFEEKKKAFEIAMREERLVEIKMAELKKEIEFLLGQISELGERIKKAEEMKKQVVYLSEIESWLTKKFIPLVSMIEKNVMIKLKKEFSNLFSEWFSMLVSETFNVKLDDNFTPVIEQHDYEVDYSYMSGGERTAVALAYRLALNQVINSLLSKIKTKDMVILDEPTDGFSAQQLDKMRDVLLQLNVGQLIIVSHEQKIENFVDNVIRFKKTSGVSNKE